MNAATSTYYKSAAHHPWARIKPGIAFELLHVMSLNPSGWEGCAVVEVSAAPEPPADSPDFILWSILDDGG